MSVVKCDMDRAHSTRIAGRFALAILVFLAGFTCAAAQVRPKFQASDIDSRGDELLVCDMDGDHLDDLVVMQDNRLQVFRQDRTGGFAPEPQLAHKLDGGGIVSPGTAGSLFVVTSTGVRELSVRADGSPAMQSVIHERTAVPEAAREGQLLYLPLTLRTGPGGQMLLLPAHGALQVWSRTNASVWRLSQRISHSIKSAVLPAVSSLAAGYTVSHQLTFSVSDANRDGLDDLMFMEGEAGLTNTYRLYLQRTNGLLEHVLTHSDPIEWNAWLYWMDLNRDGRTDLVKGIWRNEPSFVPGVPSGRVWVNVHLADATGAIPSTPQQVLRKNDWLPELPLFDIDGDGAADAALGFSHMDTREGLRKQVTARQLDYTLRFHFWRGTEFSRQADFQRQILIHLDSGDVFLTGGLPENFRRFVNLSGDFNGDRKRDLLVRERNDQLSAYYFVSRQRGFNSKPDVQFACAGRIAGWLIDDLNRDGVSDLIVTTGHEAIRVFVSRK